MSRDSVSTNVAAIEAALEVRVAALKGTRAEDAALFDQFLSASDAVKRSPVIGPDALLVERCALNAFDTMTMWTLVALSCSEKAMASAHELGAEKNGSVTAAAMRTLTGQDFTQFSSVFSSQGPLRRFGFVERSDGGTIDAHESAWRWVISRRVLAFLHGDNSIDPALAGIARIADDVKPIDQLAANEAVVCSVRDAVKGGAVTVCVSGATGLGRRTLLAAAAREAGVEVIEVDARRLAKEPALLRKQLKMIARECKLLARAPLIANVEACADVEAVGSELVSEIEGVVLVTCGAARPSLRWGRPVIVVEMAAPTSTQRVELWKAALGQGTIEDAEFLATQYPLAPAVIFAAAQAALARSKGRKVGADDIYAGIKDGAR